MKFMSHLAIVFAFIVAGLAPASAQYGPGGSYQQSCINVRSNGNQLSAQCTAPNGRSIQSSISLPCRGDISNSDGYLSCNGYHGNNGNGYNGNGNWNNNGNYNPHPGGRPPYGYAHGPNGSYQASCRNTYMQNGNVLTAECTATNGAWIRSSLNVNQCRGGTDIANIDGRLNCLYYR